LRVWVRDTGKGIAPERMATLFTPFAIAEEEIGREQRGAGLGLAISQHYCRLMGGELTITSAPGGGTLAAFWTPVRAAQVAAASRKNYEVPQQEAIIGNETSLWASCTKTVE